MILRTTGGGQVNIPTSRRDLFSGVDVIPLASQMGGTYSVAGRRVDSAKATGLPPVLRGIRLLSESAGAMPLVTYRGDPQNPGMQAIVTDCPQYKLLGMTPNGLQTAFDLKAFAVASLLGYGNTILMKTISPKAKNGRGGDVLELWPIDPERVEIKMEGHELTYRVFSNGTKEKEVTLSRADVIHIPGVLLKNPYIGVSPILIAANAMGTSLAVEEFAGRFFDNDATPGGLIEFQGSSQTQAAKDTREVWDDKHRGVKNSRRVGALFGGAKYQQIGVDAQSAQVIESQRWTIDQSANALGLPAWALGGTDQNPRSTPEERNMELLQFAVVPWLCRVEQALHADDDLFPDKEIAPRFLPDGMLRANTQARYEAYLKARQAGWLSVNDIRKKENEPPVPGGDEYQATPVGGAPNQNPGEGEGEGGGKEEDEDDDDDTTASEVPPS